MTTLKCCKDFSHRNLLAVATFTRDAYDAVSIFDVDADGRE